MNEFVFQLLKKLGLQHGSAKPYATVYITMWLG